MNSHKYNVAVIGTCGIPANYGGYETLVENLVSNNATDNICFTVFCSTKNYKNRTKYYQRARLVYIPLRANGWQAIPYDTLSLVMCYFKYDCILSLGYGGAWLLPILKMIKKTKIITNFDGLDDKREKFNSLQKFISSTNRFLAAKYSDFCIADNVCMAERLYQYYKVKAETIEYGADHIISSTYGQHLERYGLDKKEYNLVVSRSVPENNLHIILEAASKNIEEQFVLIGNWDHSKYGRDLKRNFSDLKNVKFIDPIYDQEILDDIRKHCKCYIHGHSKGGTNPALIEAMMLSVPILAYDVDFNRATTADSALFFKTAAELNGKIRLINKEEASVMSVKLHEVALEKYTWKKISSLYMKLFKAL